MTKRTALPLAIAAVLCGALWLRAGPLTPPAGPVASTYKTLSEVEPRTAISASTTPGNAASEYIISQPGAYYLTGNISTSKTTAISVQSNSVTIDLNGYVVSCASNPFIIISASTAAALNIHDGRLTADNGVNGNAVLCSGDQTILRRLSITCGGQAISTGINAIVEDVAISSNDVGTISINCGAGAQVRRVAINGAGGISLGDAALVQDSIVRSARSAGITTLTGATISGCTVLQNAANGIFAGNGATIANCTASRNGAAGIRTADGCTITACTASLSSSNDGIQSGNGCTISLCTASSNADGIYAFRNCTVSNCTVLFNPGDGITAGDNSNILGNTCGSNGIGNGGGGIYAIGPCRIEGNNCCNNAFGMLIQSQGCFIVKNTCSRNSTNWNIPSGNVYGPIIDRTSPAAAAVLGNSGPGSLVTTDPNANFSY